MRPGFAAGRTAQPARAGRSLRGRDEQCPAVHPSSHRHSSGSCCPGICATSQDTGDTRFPCPEPQNSDPVRSGSERAGLPGRGTVAAGRLSHRAGARTAWHSHAVGQTLYVTEGIALLGSRAPATPTSAATSTTPASTPNGASAPTSTSSNPAGTLTKKISRHDTRVSRPRRHPRDHPAVHRTQPRR
jgi:hypothetical protein